MSLPAATVHSHSVAISRLSTATQFVATVCSNTTLPSGSRRTVTWYSFASPFHCSLTGTGVEPRLLSFLEFSAPSKHFSHFAHGALANSRWTVCIWRTDAPFAGATSSICAETASAANAAMQNPPSRLKSIFLSPLRVVRLRCGIIAERGTFVKRK